MIVVGELAEIPDPFKKNHSRKSKKKGEKNNYVLTALNKCTSALQPGVSHSHCSYRDRACVGAQDGEDVAR